SSQLTAHSSQLTAHSSQLTALIPSLDGNNQKNPDNAKKAIRQAKTVGLVYGFLPSFNVLRQLMFSVFYCVTSFNVSRPLMSHVFQCPAAFKKCYPTN
ncbi:hypothetical protein, partial [Saccharospirillum sp.]|uniref:hypothetical protein n=1 Tax=Saccharospirillum sp. TaxID=2033801 RepID=UPI00349FD3A3